MQLCKGHEVEYHSEINMKSMQKYFCSICNLSYLTRNILTEHVRKKHKGNSPCCPECGKNLQKMKV